MGASTRLLVLALSFLVTIARAGQQAPDLALRDLHGNPHHLADWRGRVVLLNFWAAWCAPCLAEIPRLIRWQRRYGKEGLQILGVGLDEPDRLRNTVRTLGITYPILVADPSQQAPLLARWGEPNGVIPYTVLLGPDGRIQHRYRGILDEDIFEALVRPLLDPSTSQE